MNRQKLTTCCLSATLLLAAFNACKTDQANQPANHQGLYARLDSLIDVNQQITDQKEQKIKAITEGPKGIRLTPEQTYEINDQLYEAYIAFKFDSAFYYIDRNMKAATNQEQKAESAIKMAHILSVTGIFDHARSLLDAIDSQKLNDSLRVRYYNQLSELNLYQSAMADQTPFFMAYVDSMQYYRQLILQIAPKDSYDYLFNQATYECEKGNTQLAIRLLEKLIKRYQPGQRQYSILASTLAYFYSRTENPDMQEYYLLLSAISDQQGAIRENNSLRELSIKLLDRNDYRNAYRYLYQASNDARFYGSRLRSLQVARLAPVITHAYDMEREQTQQRTNRLLLTLAMIALLLAGFILFNFWLLYKRRLANRQIYQMNDELSRHNTEMKDLNTQLTTLNAQMKEANRIKDEYIGRFLELCSALIFRGEDRSKKLNRLARDRKLEELYAELKSNSAINEGIKIFHRNFDEAFLNIYPNFISEVNKLMLPESQFVMDDDSQRLTTELRVLALIRLGITDNQKIADILRSSITTIYTYRSRLKTKARERDTFEDSIRQIATY